MGDEVQKYLRELKELHEKAVEIDEDIYEVLRVKGLTESEAASGAFEDLPNPANDPVKESWLIRMQRTVGKLEAEADSLEHLAE